MSIKTPTVKLSTTNDEMPLVGMGMWKVPNDVCANTVYEAIKAGVRMFDSSSDYGNEHESGKGLKRALDEGLVKREELFIVSKLWNTYKQPEQVEIQIRRQLEDWQTEYFDLYLIHFPIALKYVDPAVSYPPGWFNAEGKIELDKAPLHKTWAAMEKLPGLKLAKNIGISNFGGQLIADLMTYAEIPPAVLQVEMHPYNVQQDLIDLCEAYGIRVMAFSTFGPASWLELGVPSATQVESLLTHPVITKIAEKHNATPGQVLLRWCTQRNIIVIPKTIKPERMVENVKSSTLELSKEDIEAVTGLDKAFRMGNTKVFDPRLAIYA
ncbi:D-xylose reductase [Naganishia albida]|nr:D-xylose reductase [Naganishia albida]